MLHHQKKAKVLKEVPETPWGCELPTAVSRFLSCGNKDIYIYLYILYIRIYIYRGSCQNPGGVLLASWYNRVPALQVKPMAILGIKPPQLREKLPKKKG